MTSLALLSQVWQIYKDRLHKSGASEEQLEAAYRQFKTYVAGAFIVAFFLFVYVNSPPAPCPLPHAVPPPPPRFPSRFTFSYSGKVGPISVRVRSLFVKHTRTGNPLVDSVAEHQATPNDIYWK